MIYLWYIIPMRPGETTTAPKYEFKYDARGIASVIKDNVLMTETRVTSDLADRPSESVTRDANGNLVHKSVLNYDGKNRVKEFIDVLPESAHKTEYTYDADNRVTEVKFDDSDTHKINYSYDLLNRITNKTVTNGAAYSTNFRYADGAAAYGANATTPLIEEIEQGSGANAMNFAYTYDSRGNITSETRNGVTVIYEYDELGQLIRVNDPGDPAADSDNGTTWLFTYDRGGNILSKQAYVLSTAAQPTELRQNLIYGYTDANWKDKLTHFCNDELTYDAIGNLTDDDKWTYTWEKGRQLKSMHNATTGVTMEFKYNHEGLRTRKVKKVNGAITETTDYILKGKHIVAMKKNTDTYYFTYDASGKPATVTYNGAKYTYVKNLQGDIVAILDTTGNLVVEYRYDAWGAPTSFLCVNIACDDLAFDNPFRYRGYVWDEETELYYLRSRYYRTEWSRFINADAYINKNALTIFSYCKNNPLLNKDSSGASSEIGFEFVFDKNYFNQFLNYNTEKMNLFIASGDPAGIPYLVNQNFKRISGYDFYIPSINIYGQEPCCMEIEYYVQFKNVQNLTSGTVKIMLELLSAEKMDELIDYVALYAGVPVDGAMVSKVAEGILKIDEKYVHFLEDYQLATVHSVRIKYNYPSFGSLYASYQFYESVDGSSIDYDGVYVHAEYRGKNNTYHAYTQYK